MTTTLTDDQLTDRIIGAAIEVHKELGGPGLLEKVYEVALFHELGLRGLPVRRQVAVPVRYKGVDLKNPHYLDLIVDERIIIEVKAVEKHNPVFMAQLLTYLRLTECRVGLVINFGMETVKQGLKRVSNGYEIPACV